MLRENHVAFSDPDLMANCPSGLDKYPIYSKISNISIFMIYIDIYDIYDIFDIFNRAKYHL